MCSNMYIWRLEDNLQKGVSSLLPPHVSRDGTPRSLGLAANHLWLLSHFASPWEFLVNFKFMNIFMIWSINGDKLYWTVFLHPRFYLSKVDCSQHIYLLLYIIKFKIHSVFFKLHVLFRKNCVASCCIRPRIWVILLHSVSTVCRLLSC